MHAATDDRVGQFFKYIRNKSMDLYEHELQLGLFKLCQNPLNCLDLAYIHDLAFSTLPKPLFDIALTLP